MQAALFHAEQDGNSNNEFAQIMSQVEAWKKADCTPVILMNADKTTMKVVSYETFGRKLH